jgi:hypothetical protein
MIRLGGKTRLPVEVAGEAIAILAKRGAGKTNTAVVLVEELHKANVQTVVLDPVGVWWGVRSGTGGTSEGGLPMPVLGGAHGDVGLEPGQRAAELVADVVVDTGQSVVVDVSEMSKTEQRTFVASFAQRLYRRKGQSRSIIHVVLEEADEFAPQRVTNKDAPMVGAISQLIRRGRSRGIGMTVITQRSASLNKDVLDQADVLIAMRTTGPRDRKAIEGWIQHQDAEGLEEVLPSLPSLATGEAWVWNPERSILDRIQVRRRDTFDTSATPGAGGKRAEPRSVAPIDLAALGKQIAETAERAKENDPAHLRKTIRAQQGEIMKLRTEAATRHTETVEVERVVEVEKIVEVPLLTDADRKLVQAAIDAVNQAGKAFALLEPVIGKLDAPKIGLDPRAARLAREEIEKLTRLPSPASSGPKEVKYAQPRATTLRPPVTPLRPDASAADANGDVLTPARLKVLDALRWFEIAGIGAPTKQALAPMAGTRHTSGGFKNNLGKLRTYGYIDYPASNQVQLTEQGRAAATEPDMTPTNESMQDAVRDVVTPAQWKILDALIGVWPEPLDRIDLAAAVDVPVTSGGFKNNLGKLRTLGAIEYPSTGMVVASPMLFPEESMNAGVA